MTDHLLLEQDGAVAVVTINRPEARNAMTFEMYEALHDACERLDRDPGVRVVVLRGAGDRAFASGTDIRQFLTFKTREDALGYEARLSRVLSGIAALTLGLAGEIAQHAPLTLAAAKEATRRLLAAQSPGSLEDLILSCYLSQDFQEGVRAFLEKRKPRWQGR